MGQQKQYDYVAATLFNPDLTPNDLMTMGVDSSTAEIKERDFYKNNEEVKKLFTDDSGNFDESKFNDFYDSTVETYNEKAQQRFEDLVLNNFEYNPGDWMSGGNRYIDASPTFSASENPLGDFSIEALGKMSASNLSAREIAQTNKVFDTETGEWMDYTPNEMGFWKTLSSPTLVLAQYDEDEYDAHGNLIHQKGEYKKSEDGRTYYETLGNRSMSNRMALSAFDVITEDGSAANKYDFFDGDGLTKSAVGAAARNAVKLLPLLIPYGIGGAYAEVSAALNFAQVLPEIGKALCGLIPGEQAETMAFLDKMEGEFAKTKGSVSDYSQAKTVTGENFFNFVGDTAIQLFQQNAVANASKKFMKTFGKTNPELAKAISVGYMGVTSSQGTWDAFKEAGASDAVAGLAVLANVAALSTLLNQNYFKDWAFKGNAIFDENITSGKPAMLAMAKQARGITEGKAMAELNPATAKNIFGKLVNYFRAGSVTDTGVTVGMTINDFVKGSLNEGLEEVMEEGSSDLIKGATQALNLLGINVTDGDKELDFGITPEDMIQRYGMALGGGIGGGLVFQTFGHLGKKNREDFAKNIKNLNDNALREVTYMIANGRGNELKRYYKRLHDNGMLGSTDLSGTQFEALNTKKEEGTTNAAITAKKGESQNDLVYDMLINQVDQLEQVFKDEGINIPESVLTKNFGAQELQQLFDSANGSTLLDESPDKAKLASLLTTCGVAGGFLNDFNYYSAKLVKAKEAYEDAIEAVKKDKPAETTEQKEALEKAVKNNADVKKTKEAYEGIKKEIEAMRKGERNAKYIKYGAFALNKDVSKAFTGLQTFDEYVLAQTGKTAKQLKKNKDRYAELEFEYEQYSANNQNKAYRGYALYEEAQKRWGNHLDTFSKQTKESKLNDSEFSASNLTMYLGYRQTLDDIDKKRSQDISDEERAKLDAQYNEAFKAYNNVRASVVGLDPLSLYVDQDAALELFNQKAKLEAEMRGLQERLKNTEGEDKEETQRRISVRAEELLVVTSQLDALDKLPADLTHALDHAVKDSTTVDKQLKANEDIKLIGDQLLTKYQKDADEKVIKTNDEQLVTFLSHITSKVVKQGMSDRALMNVIAEGSNAQRLAFGKGIITLQNYIKNGEFGKALEYLKTLKALGDEIAEEEPDEFDFDYYVGSVGDESLEDYLTKMNALRDKCTYTPTLDLLKQAYVEINGEPTSIFDLIDKQKKGLLSVESLDQFLMTEDSIKGIDKALKILDLVEGFIGGSVSGLNEILNSQGGNFAILNDNAAKAIASDLQYLKSNLQILKDLAINNSGQKLNEHRKIAVHCKPLFIKSMLEDAAKIESKMQLTTPIKDLWTKACLTTKWNESAIPTLDTYAQYEQTCIEFESLFYKSLPVDKNNLGSKIASIYEDEGMLWAGETSQLTSDLTAISAFDQAQYILSLCAIDSKVFTTALKTVNEENKKKSPDEYFSPVYGQETLIREALCSIANPTLYSEFITKINDKSNASKFKGKGYEECKNKEVKESISQSTQLERVFAILGGAGTGKTSAVLNTINLILSKVNNTTGVEMLIMAPTDVQLKNINIDSIKCSKPITKLTVEDALKKSFKYPPTSTMTTVTIGGETLSNFNATYVDSCGTRAWNGKTKGDINTLERNADGKHFTDTEAIRVIVVDECSQISGAQWEALNQIARDENAVIITTGDYHQQAAKVNTYYTLASDGTYPTMQKGVYACTNGLENFSVNKSPFIEMTMRSDNMGMYYASVQFSKLFAYCKEKASEENDVPIFGFSNRESLRIQSYFKEIGAIKVPYAKSDNWESFGGITYATKAEADKAIATLGQKNEIYYINDGTAANYSGKVNCIGLDKVQGGQKDYVVIDLDWFANGDINKRFFINELDLARTLYTLTQRAKKGVIIVDNGNNGKLKDFISTYEDNSSLLGFSMNKDARESYYNWWHKGKEKSTSTEEIGSYFIPAKASGKPTSTKGGKSTGATGTTSGKPNAQHLGKPIAGKDPHGTDGELSGKPGSNYWEDKDANGRSYVEIAKQNRQALQQTLAKNVNAISEASTAEANKEGSQATGYQQVIKDFYVSNDFDGEKNPKEHTLAQKLGIDEWDDEKRDFYQQLSAYIADTVLASDQEVRSIEKEDCVKPTTYTAVKTDDGKEWYAKVENAGRGYSEGDIQVMKNACGSLLNEETLIDNITEYLENPPTLYCLPAVSVDSKKKIVVARFVNKAGDDYIDVPLFKCSSKRTGILMQPPKKKYATGGLVTRSGIEGNQSLSSFIENTAGYCQPIGDIQIYQGPNDETYGSFSKNAVNQGSSFMLFTDRQSVVWQVKYGGANPWQKVTSAKDKNEFVHNFPESTFLISTALNTSISTALKYTCALCELRKACQMKNRSLAEAWASKVDELGAEIFGKHFNSASSLIASIDDDNNLSELLSYSNADGLNSAKYNIFAQVSPDPNTSKTNVYAQGDRLAGQLLSMSLQQRNWDGLWGTFATKFTTATDDNPASTLRIYYDDKVIKLTPTDASTNPKWNVYIEGDNEDKLIIEGREGPGITNRGKWFVDTMFYILQDANVGGTSIDYAKLKALSCWQTTVNKDTSGTIIRGSGSRMGGEELIFNIIGDIEKNKQVIGKPHEDTEAIEDAAFVVIEDNLAKHPAYKYGLYVNHFGSTDGVNEHVKNPIRTPDHTKFVTDAAIVSHTSWSLPEDSIYVQVGSAEVESEASKNARKDIAAEVKKYTDQLFTLINKTAAKAASEHITEEPTITQLLKDAQENNKVIDNETIVNTVYAAVDKYLKEKLNNKKWKYTLEDGTIKKTIDVAGIIVEQIKDLDEGNFTTVRSNNNGKNHYAYVQYTNDYGDEKLFWVTYTGTDTNQRVKEIPQEARELMALREKLINSAPEEIKEFIEAFDYYVKQDAFANFAAYVADGKLVNPEFRNDVLTYLKDRAKYGIDC